MKIYWATLMISSMLFLILAPYGSKAASAAFSIEDDEFYISVDPSDEDHGKLEVHGTVEGSIENILDRVTVTLEAAITEHRDGEPTGMKWACTVTFDGLSVDTDTTILTRNDDQADFTVLVSPEVYDPQDEDVIAVPTGIGPNVTGELEVTAIYSGDASGTDTETATIIPEYYHLVRVSTNTAPLEITANKFINYSFRVMNEGNDVESITLELPTLEELVEQGWTGSVTKTHEDLMEPGSEFRATMHLQAPKKIESDRTVDFKAKAYTDFFDPVTGEPASEDEITIEFQLKESEFSDPVADDDADDDTTDDDVIDDDTAGEYDPANDSPVALIIVISVVVLIVALVLIIFFIKGGGGDEGDQEEPDIHSSMVRI
ncbi:MAG: hypothetical protein R6V01_09465 [Thermoplasmatota archaeon]